MHKIAVHTSFPWEREKMDKGWKKYLTAQCEKRLWGGIQLGVYNLIVSKHPYSRKLAGVQGYVNWCVLARYWNFEPVHIFINRVTWVVKTLGEIIQLKLLDIAYAVPWGHEWCFPPISKQLPSKSDFLFVTFAILAFVAWRNVSPRHHPLECGANANTSAGAQFPDHNTLARAARFWLNIEKGCNQSRRW